VVGLPTRVIRIGVVLVGKMYVSRHQTELDASILVTRNMGWRENVSKI
jgi:hypothetical protein